MTGRKGRHALKHWETAPDQLPTSDGEATRPVCAYPYVPRWDGTGDPDQPESFDCKPNYGRWGTPGKR